MPRNNVAGLTERLTGTDRRLKLSFGLTVNSSKIRNVELTWIDFLKRLRNPVRTKERIEEYLAAPRETQDKIKDVGYFVPGHFESGKRKKKNIKFRSCITLDVDHASTEFMDEIEFSYGDKAYAMYTTHKHKPDSPRFRLVMPLLRDVNEIEYMAIARKVASWWDMDVFDDTTYQFSRVMHYPSCSRNGEFKYHENEAKWIDPDEVLATYDDWNDVAQWPVSSRQGDALRVAADKAGNPLEKTGVVGAFCRQYTVREAIDKFLPGVYVDGSTEDRMTYVAGSASNGAVIYDDDLFLYSHHESDPCSMRLVNAWDLVRLHKFGSEDEGVDNETPINKRPSSVSMTGLALDVPEVKVEMLRERLEDFDAFDSEAEHDGPDVFEDELDEATGGKKENSWMMKLRINSKGAIVACLSNLELILDNDKELTGCVRFNDFANLLYQTGSIPGLKKQINSAIGELWSDLAELKIKSYLERKYSVTMSATAIHEAAMTIGDKYRYHPIREYLDRLEWDKKLRLDKFLVKYFGAEDNEYVRSATRKWFAGAVARIYVPGIKMDYMLVLEGVEGLRKSTLFSVLAKGFFTDDMGFGYDSKEVVEKTAGCWIVEIPEMVTRTNADTEHVKAFISRQTEKARLSYLRNADCYHRQFVLAGTTNEGQYLRSLTGNRRFWPIKGDAREFDLESIASVVDQLWAEAKHRFEAGEKLYLDSDEAITIAKQQQEQRVIKDDLVSVIENWIERPIRKNYWETDANEFSEFDKDEEMVPRDRVLALEVWTELMGGDLRTFSQREARRINEALRQCRGWEEHATVRFGNRYGRTRGFLRVSTPGTADTSADSPDGL